jgi:hypothetical protein
MTRSTFRLPDFAVLTLVLAASASLATPTILRMRDKASTEQCRDRLKQLGLAAHNHHDSIGTLPPAARGPAPGPEGSAFFHLLPYLEQDFLFKSAGKSVRTNGVWSTPLPTLTCPSDVSNRGEERFAGWLATGSYATNFLLSGDPKTGGYDGKWRMVAVTDGTSNTLLFGERYRVCRDTPNGWAYPDPTPWCPTFGSHAVLMFQVRPPADRCDPLRPQSSHFAGMPVCRADGAAVLASTRIDPVVWGHLCGPQDGMITPEWEVN